MGKTNDVVIIDLDRPRQIKFTYTSLKTLAELTGKTLNEFDDSISLTNFEFLGTWAYCGLLHDAKKNGEVLTLENVESLLDEAPSFSHVLDKLFTAWRVAFGEPAQVAPEGNQPEPETQPAQAQERK